MIRFRPLPGLTAACLIMLTILIGLGVWQVQRLHWKLDLIATMDAHLKAPPLPLAQMLAMPPDQAQYRRVLLTGRFDNAKEAYVFGTGAGGAALYHVLTPLRTADGKTVMVDRGAVPREKLAPASRAQVTGDTMVVGVWRTPDRPGFFTPPVDAAKRIWYGRDLAAIARADGVVLAAPVLVEADATPNPGGWPQGGQTVIDLPNNHLSYAVTWFGLAAGLVGVYLAFHASKGRLGRA